MPRPLFYARTTLAWALSSNVAAASYLVSLPPSWPGIHKLAHVLCQALRPLLHKPPISSDDPLFRGFLTQTWSPVRVASSLHQQAPGKPQSMSALTLPPPLWSLIKSCLLPEPLLTTLGCVPCFLNSNTICRCSHSTWSFALLAVVSTAHVSPLGLCCTLTVCPVTCTLLHPSNWSTGLTKQVFNRKVLVKWSKECCIWAKGWILLPHHSCQGKYSELTELYSLRRLFFFIQRTLHYISTKWEQPPGNLSVPITLDP